MSATTAIPLAIICVAAPLGALDISYFHIYRFRLYARRSARAETVTHLLRGAIVCAAVWMLARYEPRGAWFALLAALFGIDFGNTVVDVVLEPRSRAALGGIPPLEYLIHFVGATANGAIGASFLVSGWPLFTEPSALVPSTLPSWLSTTGVVISAGALLTTLFESALMLHAWRRAASGAPQTGLLPSPKES